MSDEDTRVVSIVSCYISTTSREAGITAAIGEDSQVARIEAGGSITPLDGEIILRKGSRLRALPEGGFVIEQVVLTGDFLPEAAGKDGAR